jgi:phage FluMu protein Com
MPLTFLCAGCSPDERDVAEASVKAALGERTRSEAWVVSIVRSGANWSVTLDGPEHRALSFVAADTSLGDSIRERLTGRSEAAPPATAGAAPRAAAEHKPDKPAPTAAPQPAVGLGSMRDRHECRSCRRAFAVIYEVEDSEDQEMVSIACPHCWQMNHVLIAEAAAITQAFRAEKLEA